MKNKSKVLVFTQNLHGGGAERVLVNYLNKLATSKHKVTLVMVKKEGELLPLIDERVKIHDLNKSSTSRAIWGLAAVLRREAPDYVFSSLARTHIILFLATKISMTKTKVILRSPNSPSVYMKEHDLGAGGISLRILSLAYRNSDRVVAQTEQMKSELITYHKVKSDKISVIFNPIDFSNIDDSLNKGKSPLNPKFKNVVASGRLVKQKGFDVLIESWKLVVTRCPNFRLNILGKDVVGLQSVYEKRLVELGIDKYVLFHGFTENPYVYYRDSDVFVLSSRWEGMPNTVFENLYLGKPIVATKCISFMGELIDNGKNGFLVDVEDVEGIANAIINYNKLTPSEFDFSKFNQDVLALFKD